VTLHHVEWYTVTDVSKEVASTTSELKNSLPLLDILNPEDVDAMIL